jgi:spore maturation protein CgeB
MRKKGLRDLTEDSYRRAKHSVWKTRSHFQMLRLINETKHHFNERIGPREGGRSTYRDVRAACVLDDFTYEVLKGELQLFPIIPDRWFEPFEHDVDMLLVEAFWRGSGGTWRSIAYDYNVKERGLLRRIVSWCKGNGIPTVFWAKEDPPHFDEFKGLATEFDFIFTTDKGCVSRYQEMGKEARVLQFAAQPSLHNPMEIYDHREDRVSFAGSYIPIYPERTRDFDVMASALSDIGMDIYDRNLERKDPRYRFPTIYQPMIKGMLKGEEILLAYKGYRYGLNMNSIKDSETMFARRVFELMACNTIVISNASVGLKGMFGDLVICSDDPDEIKMGLDRIRSDDRAYNRMRLLALRAVMDGHTYQDRAEKLIEIVLGIAPGPRERIVSCVLCDDGGFPRERSQREFGSQTHPSKRLVPLEANDEEGLRHILGQASKEGGLVAMWRPQDHYGPHYLSDMAMAFHYSPAMATTKHSKFTGGPNIAVDGQQYHWVKSLAPGAIMIDPSKFPLEQAMSLFQGDQMEIEEGCLSLDEFNYIEACPLGTDISFSDA